MILDDTGGGPVRVLFQRVEYDIDTTVRKVHDNPDLTDLYGDRLREGR